MRKIKIIIIFFLFNFWTAVTLISNLKLLFQFQILKIFCVIILDLNVLVFLFFKNNIVFENLYEPFFLIPTCLYFTFKTTVLYGRIIQFHYCQQITYILYQLSYTIFFFFLITIYVWEWYMKGWNLDGNETNLIQIHL